MKKLNRRILYSTKPITPERAMELWKAKVTASMEDLKDALDEPLPTTESVLTEVGPDDPGYEKANYEVTYSKHPLTFKIPIK